MLAHLRTAAVAAVIAVGLSTAASAIAGTGIGGVFNLGQTNTVNETTKLSGAKAGPMLDVANTSTGTGATALRLAPAAGKPPLTSSSTATATGLSADLVDGLEARFLTRSASAASPPTSFFEDRSSPLLSTQLNAPVQGFVTLTGAVIAGYSNACSSFCSTHLKIRDTTTGQVTQQASWVGADGPNGSRSTLVVTATIPASKALHTYELVSASFGPDVPYFFNAALSAEFSAFNGVGTSTPSAATATATAAAAASSSEAGPPQAPDVR